MITKVNPEVIDLGTSPALNGSLLTNLQSLGSGELNKNVQEDTPNILVNSDATRSILNDYNTMEAGCP